MLKVEIVDATVSSRSGQNARGNYTIRSQQGVLVAGAFRYPFEVRLDGQDAVPFAPGTVLLIADESFGTDRYGNIELKRLVLKAVPQSAARQAG